MKLGVMLGIVATLLVAREGRALPFDPAGHDWEGYADFVALARAQLGDAFVVTSSLSFDDVRAEDALILVHPERPLDVDSLSAFLSAGGRVVLLDDFGTGDRLLRRYGIQRVSTPTRPDEMLRNNPELAIAEPVGNHGLTLGVTRVVTNHASGVLDPSLTPLLEIAGQSDDRVVVAMLGVVARGAFVVVGDPSAFMNSMLRYPGNKRFDENLVAWSARGQGGQHSGKVYLACGSFAEEGSFASPHPPGFGEVARGARASGDFWGSQSLGTRGAHLVAAVLGLLVVVWIGSRAGRIYRIVEPRMTRPLPLFAQGGSAGRAAILGAPRANRAQAMLELGKALEEELTISLGLDRVPAHDTLLHEVELAGVLDRPSLDRLRALLSRIAHIDTMTRAGRVDALQRVRDTDVLAAAKVVQGVLERFTPRAHAGRAA